MLIKRRQDQSPNKPNSLLRSYAEDSKLQMVAEKIEPRSAYGHLRQISPAKSDQKGSGKRHGGAATSSRRDRKARVSSIKPIGDYRSKGHKSRSNTRSIDSFRDRAVHTSKPSLTDAAALLQGATAHPSIRYDRDSEEGNLSSVGHRRVESIPVSG